MRLNVEQRRQTALQITYVDNKSQIHWSLSVHDNSVTWLVIAAGLMGPYVVL